MREEAKEEEEVSSSKAKMEGRGFNQKIFSSPKTTTLMMIGLSHSHSPDDDGHKSSFHLAKRKIIEIHSIRLKSNVSWWPDCASTGNGKSFSTGFVPMQTSKEPWIVPLHSREMSSPIQSGQRGQDNATLGRQSWKTSQVFNSNSVGKNWKKIHLLK